MPVVVAKDTCIGCGACVGVCPVGALSLDADGKAECNTSVLRFQPAESLWAWDR